MADLSIRLTDRQMSSHYTDDYHCTAPKLDPVASNIPPPPPYIPSHHPQKRLLFDKRVPSPYTQSVQKQHAVWITEMKIKQEIFNSVLQSFDSRENKDDDYDRILLASRISYRLFSRDKNEAGSSGSLFIMADRIRRHRSVNSKSDDVTDKTNVPRILMNFIQRY